MYNFKKTCLLLSLILSQSVSILAIIDTTAPGLTDPQVLSGAIKINSLSREAKSNDNALALEISNAAANVIEDQAQALATSKKESEFDQKTIFDIQEQIDKQNAQIESNDAEKAALQNSLNQSEAELSSSFNQDFANQQVAGTKVSNASLSMAVVFSTVTVGLIAAIIALVKKSQKDKENTFPRLSKDIDDFKSLVDQLNDGKFFVDEASVRKIVDFHYFLKINKDTITIDDVAMILDDVSEIVSKKLRVGSSDPVTKQKFEYLKAEISKLKSRRSSTWNVTIDSNRIDSLKTRINDSVRGLDYSKELKAAEEQRAAEVANARPADEKVQPVKPVKPVVVRPLMQELPNAETQQNSTETQADQQKSENDILLETIEKAKKFVEDNYANKFIYEGRDPDILVSIFKTTMKVDERYSDVVDSEILSKYLENALIDKVLQKNSTPESLAQSFETGIIEKRIKKLDAAIDQRSRATKGVLGGTNQSQMARQVPEIINRTSEISELNTQLEKVRARVLQQGSGPVPTTPAPLAPVLVTPAAPSAQLNPTEEAVEPKLEPNQTVDNVATLELAAATEEAEKVAREHSAEAAKTIKAGVDAERQKEALKPEAREAAARKIQDALRNHQRRAEEVTKKRDESLRPISLVRSNSALLIKSSSRRMP